MHQAKCIIDYTHAKQNIGTVVSTIQQTLKVSGKEAEKLSCQVKDFLWNGNIAEILELAKKKLSRKRKARKTALKKLGNYFGDHSKFQYKAFADMGLPIGSGSIESAIRRVINLRVKSTGMFWKREHAENVIFLRSLVLTGKLRNACRTACNVMKSKYWYSSEGNLKMVAS